MMLKVHSTNLFVYSTFKMDDGHFCHDGCFCLSSIIGIFGRIQQKTNFHIIIVI